MRILHTRLRGALVGTVLLASGVVAGCGLTTQSATSALQSRSTPATSTAPAVPGGVTVAGPSAAGNTAPAPMIVQAAPNIANGTSTSLAHSITVSGTGEIKAVPDEAFVSAGVQTRAQTAQEAQSTNNTQMQAVINAVKAMGIPDSDIQTSGVSLYPVYGTNQTLEGYQARNTISITVEKIDQAGQVLDAVVKAGANETAGIQFGLKNQTALRNKALAAAVADARSKADALAAAAGVKITSVEAVSETSVNVPVLVSRASVAAAASQAVPVEPGQLTVSAQVTVAYGY